MTKKERAIIKKIEAKFPRDKIKKGEFEVKLELNGELVCPARDAVEHIEYIIKQIEKVSKKHGEGSFRVVKVASAAGAAELAGLSDDECDAIDTDLMFVIPNNMKDPTQEFGPCYTIYFK